MKTQMKMMAMHASSAISPVVKSGPSSELPVESEKGNVGAAVDVERENEGASVGMGTGTGVGAELGGRVGDGVGPSVSTETESTVASDIVRRRRRSAPLSSASKLRKRRWPNRLA